MTVRPLPIVAVVLLVFSGVPAPAIAAPPLADAGLDQTVSKGSTVHLDATGSRDPDGTITAYNWTITDPAGTNLAPDCPTCSETTFTAASVGRYEVTITITGNDGETATDTLYVVVEPGEPPTLVLTGPNALHTGQTGTYVAEPDAGDADLKTITWYVDGAPIETESINGSTATLALDRQFATTGAHHVSARVVDTDDQTAEESLPIHITNPPTDPAQSAARGTATIEGPQVLTGDEPLRGEYTLTGTNIRRATWWVDGTRTGTGRQLTTTLPPGDHTVHARVTYDDGTTGIARFDDGTTRVVADPRPRLTVDTLNGIGGLNVSTTATDEYGNLRHLEVRIDGQPVITHGHSRTELRHDDIGQRLTLETLGDVDPGRYTATIIATDARGQTRTAKRRIDVRGPPELLSAEFTNDLPLETYHPRIDPTRYTATHVVELQLNGADPANVAVWNSPVKPLESLENDECRGSSRIIGDRLVKTSCWANPTPSTRKLETIVEWNYGDSGFSSTTAQIRARHSKPELRVRVLSGGAGSRATNWGLVVDASQSFDPDGGVVGYKWLHGARNISADGSIGKFDSYSIGGLFVEDDEFQRTYMRELFTQHFNPRVDSVTTLSQGPYLPNESIRYLVSTRPYELPKGNYREDVSLQLKPSAGVVEEHYVYEGEFSGDINDDRLESYVNSSRGNHDQQYWIVTVPARAFSMGTVSFETFNEFNPTETRDSLEFPSPLVLKRGTTDWSDAEFSTRYVVQEPTFAVKDTVYPTIRDELKAEGFTLVDVRESGREWSVERKEKVSAATYENRTREFDTRGQRSAFLDLFPSWRDAGSVMSSVQKTEIEHVWRSKRAGEGTFTGDTRRVQTQPREYRTEREYQYHYTVSEKRTRWVTKTYRYPDRVSYSVSVTRCNRYIGCYQDSVRRTKWVTKTGTRRVRRTYTVSERRTGTYWSTNARHPDHTFTGNTRLEIVQRAKYDTQYRYRIERNETSTERVYRATKTELVEPASYEWVPFKKTRSELVAKQLEATPDTRLASVEPVNRWTLKKQTGTTTKEYRSYTNESAVERTRILVSGTIIIPYQHPKTGTVERTTTETIDDAIVVAGYVHEEDAREKYLDKTEGGQDQ